MPTAQYISVMNAVGAELQVNVFHGVLPKYLMSIKCYNFTTIFNFWCSNTLVLYILLSLKTVKTYDVYINNYVLIIINISQS